MILGIGTDIVEIRRFEEALAKHGEKLERRLFHESEIALANARLGAGLRIKAATLAKRFAAREAFVKAAGVGFGKGIYYKDVWVEGGGATEPKIALSDRAREVLRDKFDGEISVNLSLSDDGSYALAFVVVSREIPSGV